MMPATPKTPIYETRSLRSAERAAIGTANEAISTQSSTPKNSRKRTPKRQSCLVHYCILLI